MPRSILRQLLARGRCLVAPGVFDLISSVGSDPAGIGRIKCSRFSDEQIIGVLKEHEAGPATADVCRRHGISGATFYKRKAKFGGLNVTKAKRLRTLEEEIAGLKKLLAEAMLDIAAPKDISAKNAAARRKAGGGCFCPALPRAERASGV